MLGAEGQRRASLGLAQTNNDHLVLQHGKTPLCRWPVDVGFPEVGNRDPGNPGRGERVATWRATLPASLVLGNVATVAQIVDGQDKVVIEDTFPVAIHKEVGKALLVYVNWYFQVK